MAWLPRVVVRGIQESAAHEPVASLARFAFRTTASLIAHDIARIEGVRTVYLTGSWATPGTAAPGYSDIDLLVAVDLPTTAAELGFRDALARAQLRWNLPATLLKHIDYVERRDLPLLMRGGSEYWVDADRRFLPIAGERTPMPAGNAHRHRSAIRRASAIKRWLRVSQVLLDPGFVRDEAITRRAATRLLTGIAADRLDEGAYLPLPRVRQAARNELPELARIPIADEGAPLEELVLSYCSAALALLEAMCLEGLPSPSAVDSRTTAAGPELEVAARDAAFDGAARQAGFAGGLIVELVASREVGVAYVLSDEPPEAACRRMRARFSEVALPAELVARGVLRPALVTRPLFARVASFPPVLRIDAAIGSRPTVFGTVPPPEDDLRNALLDQLSLALLYRPRGHRFRVDRDEARRLMALAEDVRIEAPRLAAQRA